MSTNCFYSPASNFYWETLTTPTEETRAEYPSDTVEVPQRPAHYYDFVNGTWAINTGVRDAYLMPRIRAQRDAYLEQHIDPIVSNPLRWGAMSTTKQVEWSAYRQALLDVPQQAGFPASVTWPVKPE